MIWFKYLVNQLHMRIILIGELETFWNSKLCGLCTVKEKNSSDVRLCLAAFVFLPFWLLAAVHNSSSIFPSQSLSIPSPGIWVVRLHGCKIQIRTWIVKDWQSDPNSVLRLRLQLIFLFYIILVS